MQVWRIPVHLIVILLHRLYHCWFISCTDGCTMLVCFIPWQVSVNA